jgi:DNA-binding response OmpR family regulator
VVSARAERLTLLPRGDEWVEGWRGAQMPREPGTAIRVLLVDATPDGDEQVAEPLAAAGLMVLRVRSGLTALKVLADEVCDLVLLDAHPADISGFQLCRDLRGQGAVPVIFLSSDDALAGRLLAFDLGADDFIVRPAAPEEVERRVRAVLRRSRPAAGRVVLEGPAGITVRLLEHALWVEGVPVTATPKEFDLMRLMLERRGEVLSADDISTSAWGYATMGSRNFVEAHISRLRSKLTELGADEVIETVRGVGYVIR